MKKLEPGHLSRATCSVEGLDDQWVPRTLLQELLAWERPREKRLRQINGLARQEYLRALLNSRHVLINRAYIYNSPAVNQDFLDEGKRDSFGQLLTEPAIVPVLFRESDPGEKPTFGFRQEAHEAWRSVLRNYDAACARLSWSDDSQNEQLSHRLLSLPFHNFAATLANGEVERLADRLGLVRDAAPAFRKRLKDLRDETNRFHDENDRHVTRRHLYEKFVCADGEGAVEAGRYDKNKPFSGPIKELLDLRYNVNLPDAMRTCSLTAQDSLPRSALPLEQISSSLPIIDPTKLAEQLIALREFEILTSQLWRLDLNRLELRDVLAIRSMAQWRAYVEAVEYLLDHPLEFADEQRGIRQVIGRYQDVSPLIRDRLKRRAGQTVLESAHSGAEYATLAVSLAMHGVGTLLHIALQGGKLLATVFPHRVGPLINRSEKLVGSFVLASKATDTDSEPEMSQQWLEGRVTAAKDAIEEMIAELEKNGATIRKAGREHRTTADETSNNSLPEET